MQINTILQVHKEIAENANKTSATKEGKGGAETVKKKDKTIIKDNNGLTHSKPRIKIC
jgi:hypothetical protein